MSNVAGFEDLRKVMDELTEKYPPVKNPFDLFPLEFGGLKIIEEPKQPQKIKLSDDVTVSDEFRSDFDSWLLGFFGRKESIIGDGFFWAFREYGMMIGNSRSIMSLKTMV